MGLLTMQQREAVDAVLAEQFPGNFPFVNLRVENDVVDNTHVTIAGDRYEIEVVATDSGDNTANGDWVGTADPLEVDLTQSDYANMTALSPGDVLQLAGEMLLMTGTRQIGGVTFTQFKRGYAGTTNATHANGVDIDEAAAARTAGAISVPLIATLTPAAYAVAMVAVLNYRNTKNLRAIDLISGTNEILIVRTDAIAYTAACSENLAGTDNTIDAAFRGGVAAHAAKFAHQSRVPTAAEVGTGIMHFPIPFDPLVVLTIQRTTATGLVDAYVGKYVMTAAANDNPAYVTLDNSGAVDFATTDTIDILIMG